jgi:hypothetical protein
MSSCPEKGTPVGELVGPNPEYTGPQMPCLAAMVKMGYGITPAASPPQAQAPTSPYQGFEAMIKPQAPSMGG